MQGASIIKQERMHIRLDAIAKQTLEKAAQFSHKTLSDFVLSYALESANKVIIEHEKITLTEDDFSIFLDALEHPPKPNVALKEAFELHKQSVQ